MTTTEKKIAYLHSRWHADIVDQALAGFRARLGEATAAQPEIEVHELPGAFELPLAAQMLARRGDVAAVVCAGFVVDGGIYRHDFVEDAVVSGLMRVQLDTGVPVFSVVLTPHNFQESDDHIGFFRAHFVKKGREAADAVLATLKTHAKIEGA